MKSYLMHHGILGQKWGVRRFEDKNGRLTAAGKERYGKGGKRQNTGEEESKPKEKFWTEDRIKKAAKVGAIAVGSAIVAYGGYKLATDPHVRSAIADGISKLKNEPSIEEMIQNSGPEIVKKDDTNRKGAGGIQTDFKGINPNLSKAGTDVNFLLTASDGIPLQNCNCQACALAYEIKRRTGEDASARLVDTREMGYLIDKAFKDPKPINTKVTEWNELSDALNSFGNGSRGMLTLRLPDSIQEDGTTKEWRHTISFEINNGIPMLFDTQNEKAFPVDYRILDNIYHANKNELQILRTDNLEFNDEHFIDSIVLRRSKDEY